MREILFRGKANFGEWFEGFYVHIPCGRGNIDEHLIQTVKEDGRIGMLTQVVRETVGQYTGLCDKNGKKIFEGDILAYWNEDQNRYVAKCVAKYGEFNCTCCDGIYGWYFDGGDIRFARDDSNYYEVIGNIHDNPGLLEADNEHR